MDKASVRCLEAKQTENMTDYICGSIGSTFGYLLYGKQLGDLRHTRDYELDNGEADYKWMRLYQDVWIRGNGDLDRVHSWLCKELICGAIRRRTSRVFMQCNRDNKLDNRKADS
jgi:hypothetical protein